MNSNGPQYIKNFFQIRYFKYNLRAPCNCQNAVLPWRNGRVDLSQLHSRGSGRKQDCQYPGIQEKNEGKKSKSTISHTMLLYIAKLGRERGVEDVFKMPVEFCVTAWKI